jgi:hypothetical protein
MVAGPEAACGAQPTTLAMKITAISSMNVERTNFILLSFQ